MTEGRFLHLTKHHAAGNDFLVLMDLAGDRPVSQEEARALCDRRRGVGADGILRARSGGVDAHLAMDLHNADGSPAEMSGNGIRCLVQAAVDAGAALPGAVIVETPCGLRRVDYEVRGAALGHGVVEMGRAVLGEEMSVERIARAIRARTVDMGNPHIVLLCEEVDDGLVEETGAKLSRSVEGGANVEFVIPGANRGSIVLRVYERGVGETLACGTGACAAAAAMEDWGLVDSEVEVHQPGGVLEVQVDARGLSLSGPTRKVAEVSLRETELAELVREHSRSARARTYRATGPTGELAGRP